VRNGTSWSQQAYLKASNTDAYDVFGWSVALSGDTALVGAQGEASNASGVNGDQGDNSITSSGAAYMFVLDTSSVLYCSGDGSGTSCPCGNAGAAGHGCANSANAAGANLTCIGIASLASDSLLLAGSGMTNSSVLYFQGTTQVVAGNGAPFGDGLRCAGGSVVRLSTKTNVGGSSQYPDAGDASVSVRGQIASPGVRSYQCWYRNAAAFCQPQTFNLTNGLQVTWAP
jgi:hypothetical protein